MSAAEEANTWKDKGNKALREKDYSEAIRCYTEAVYLDITNHVHYSNRSAVFATIGKYTEALEDAEKTVELKPDWPKGYSRLGAALTFLKRYGKAADAYRQGLRLDPNNEQFKKGLADCEREIEASKNALPNPFAAPDALNTLRADPSTKAYLDQPDFMVMFNTVKENRQAMIQFMHEPRFIKAMGVLLGVNMDAASDSESPRNSTSSATADRDNSTSAAGSGKKPQKENKGKTTTDTDNLTAEQRKSIEEKELGNAAYKKKEFDIAIQHYTKAMEYDPNNMTFYTNRAAVHFEKGDYSACIEDCKKGVEIGRENRTDFKIIAKAFARIANAFVKMEKYEDAIHNYEKSLSEYRAKDVLKKYHECKRIQKEIEKKAYINPELSMEEKKKGNECFQNGSYPDAVKHYTEAIKRNPDDSKIYSNRAACYIKLAEFSLGLKDCEECIRLDPNFIKGYLRKGNILLAMKENAKASAAFSKALELDPDNREAQEGSYRCSAYNETDPKKRAEAAMQDPEIRNILSDPAMRLILEQMQNDPNALRDHLQNPEVAHKLQKLIESGIIGIR